MFLKLKEFGGISFRPEESVLLSTVRVGPYVVALVCKPPEHNRRRRQKEEKEVLMIKKRT